MTTIPYKHETTSEHTRLDTVTFWCLVVLAVAVPIGGTFYLRSMTDFSAIGAFFIGAAIWIFGLILLMALALARGSEK
jgi:hypothetical protein